MRLVSARSGVLGSLIVSLLAACSSDHMPKRQANTGALDAGFGNAQAQAGTSASNAGSGFGNSDGMGGAVSSRPRDAGVHAPGAASCVGTNQDAQQVEVDMYIMLDRSDSMTLLTGSGISKWDAMRQALTSFVGDSKSSGLGVGLQYFPIGADGIPDHCMTDNDCGASGGLCGNKACQPPRFGPDPGFTPCLSRADCPLSSGGCVPFGVCEKDATYACLNIAADGCQSGNPPLGACLAQAGSCSLYATCDINAYQTPAVPIALLPGNAKAVTDSLAARMPAGLTPTPVALLGAINQAADYATKNPTHRVIAVLATDGLPTDCVPQGTQTIDQAVTVVENIAAQGLKPAAGTPSISTYVIGVFTSSDGDAMTKLDGMAKAGGTDHALIIDVSQDVAQQFLAALASIRTGILACDYALPKAPAGQTLDPNLVNVVFNDGSGVRDIGYVAKFDQCAKSDLGWYYDNDPNDPTTNSMAPTKIIVCPKTCDTLQGAAGGSIKINLGCDTRGPL